MLTKKIVLIIIVMFFAVVTGYVVYAQIIVPTTFEVTNVEIADMEETDEFVSTFAKECDEGTRVKTDYPVSYNGKLPSDNSTDYKIAYLRFNGVNRSILDNYNVVGALGNATKYKENIMFACTSDSAFSLRLSRRDNGGTYVILVLYTGNLSEEQIRELINGITLNVKSYGDFSGTRTRTLSYKNCNKIEFVPVPEE